MRLARTRGRPRLPRIDVVLHTSAPTPSARAMTTEMKTCALNRLSKAEEIVDLDPQATNPPTALDPGKS